MNGVKLKVFLWIMGLFATCMMGIAVATNSNSIAISSITTELDAHSDLDIHRPAREILSRIEQRLSVIETHVEHIRTELENQ
jgi:hypothetical protein|tara:strand:- start:525 stop:770 length:246 start_codon:yes stop_codon:yes gene_type:complete